MTAERRRNRSEVIQEAVRLYLEALTERTRIKAVALASDEGLLVAGAGRGYDLDGLAALGVTGASQQEELRDVIEEVTRGEGLVACDVDVHGRTLHLSAVGSQRLPLEDAVAALGRIFAPFFGGSAPMMARG